MSRAERIFVLVLAMVQFTHIMDFMILMPLGPQLMRIFEINPQQFGFIVSVYTFAAGVSGFLGAFFLDKFDRKKALLVLYVGFAAGTLGCALAPSYPILLVARAVAGIFGGIMGALILSIVGDTIPMVRRGEAMGILMASFSVASVAGVPFGLYLASVFSWHAPFFFVAGIALLNMLMIWYRIPNMTGHINENIQSVPPVEVLARVGRDKNQVRALCFTSLLMLSQFILIPFVAQAMVANGGMREDQLPLMYLFGGGMTIFTSPLVGRIADRRGKKIVFTIASLLLIIPQILITNLWPMPVAIALLITTIFFVVGNARFIPSMALVTATVRPETRGSFMSVNTAVQSLSQAIASLIAGFIVQLGASGQLLNYNWAGYFAIVMSLLAIPVGRRLMAVEN